MKARIFDDSFDADVNTHNCDYLKRFIAVCDNLDLDSQYKFSRPAKFSPLIVSGMPVSIRVDVLVSRTNQRNKIKLGAVMLRYAKGKALSPKVALHQSAFMFEYFRQNPFLEGGEAEKKLCTTLDAYAGEEFEAPGNSHYLFKEMSAACAMLIERWPNIKPPKNAIF